MSVKTDVSIAGHSPLTMRMLANFTLAGPVCTALGAVGAGALILKTMPWVVESVFIGGAARLTGLLAGVPVVRMDEGWSLGFAEPPLMVTAACSATDFFMLTTVLLAWHFARRTKRAVWLPAAAAGALVAAVPLTVFINALRLIAVAQAHRWVIPQLPAAYESFLHMLTGMAVFLPALIALNFFFEIHGRSQPRTPVSA